MKAIVYDCTLREGAQGVGASFSVEDKLKIVDLLDGFGVPYIEAGNPASNPKDKEFFERLATHPLRQATLAAFGSTALRGNAPQDDGNIQALLAANTPVVTIFGKSWDFHATEILGITKEENLEVIRTSIEYLISQNRRVFFDAEHFFDGYKHNPEYAMEVLTVAKNAGAEYLVLCETNGGCFPHEVGAITREVVERFGGGCVGMHCHNDTQMAAANTIQGLVQGAQMAQVTMNGIGERTGNADLFTLVPNLQLKLGYDVVSNEQLRNVNKTCRQFCEIANVTLDEKTPYVGNNAFTHKAGMHIDGVSKNPTSFEHINPDLVGRSRKFVLSEVAGRMAVLQKAQSIVPGMEKSSPETKMALDKLKELENQGYVFEGAEASFELVIRRMLQMHQPFFTVNDYRAFAEDPEPGKKDSAYSVVEVQVGEEVEINAGKGNGPVNALDMALRKALERFYPALGQVYLTDYKVRVLDSKKASASKVRVLIESTDGSSSWSTIGVSSDIIHASFLALVDSIEFKLLKEK